MTASMRRLFDVIRESAVRRLGKPTLVGFAVLVVFVVIGVAASVGWSWFSGHKSP